MYYATPSTPLELSVAMRSYHSQNRSTLHNSPYIRFFTFFGLRENPFTVSPNPRYLFLTRQLQTTLDSLAFGIQSRGGIILLTGEVGTGKTTVVNRLLDWLRERSTPTAFIFNSHLEPKHLFDFMLADFGVRRESRWKGNTLMCLTEWLSERRRESELPVLIVDEGQGLPLHVLEEIGMLLNLETPQEKLLQVVLVGQPELEEKLNRPDMRYLKQRITLRCKTGIFTLEETREYIQARLNMAGAGGNLIFAANAINSVHAYSRGIPRVMNLLCEHALIHAYAEKVRVVRAPMVEEIAREFQFDQEAQAPSTQFIAAGYPASIYEPWPTPEPSQPSVQEVSPCAIRTAEVLVSLAAITPIETSPPPLPAVPSDTVLPDRNTPIRDPRPASILPVPTHSLPIRGSTVKTAKKASEMNAASNRRMIAKVVAGRRLAARSAIIRSRIIKKSRDYWETLHHAWGRAVDSEVWSQVAVGARSRVAHAARQLWIFILQGMHACQRLWRDARPHWQRIKGLLLQRLEQVLVQGFTSTARVLNAWLTMVWARILSSAQLLRSKLLQRSEYLAAILPANRFGMKAPLVRWLRQPFRPSQLRHLRTTRQRNRMSSAL
jgi:general secretion pathway protein A